MPIVSVIVLAVVQGLTEFLPVSSKTHLLFAREFLGMEPDLFFDVVLHGGSLLAILVYYRRTWLEIPKTRRHEILPLIVGSVPIVLTALLLRKHIEALYTNLVLASGVLVATGAYLFVADRFGREQAELKDLPLWKALLIGLAQACAVLPGVSRSGSTIGAGFLCGLRRADAVRFSFFLGAIAVAGALFLKTLDALKGEEKPEGLPILVGVLVTFAVSLAAIRVVEILSLKGRFSVFALYCAVVGVLGLIFFTMRG